MFIARFARETHRLGHAWMNEIAMAPFPAAVRETGGLRSAMSSRIFRGMAWLLNCTYVIQCHH
jgi:hypothetical protein